MRDQAEPVSPGRADIPLWRHRDFLLLWSGQAVSDLGSMVTPFALTYLAVTQMRATAFEVGALTAAGTAAFAVFAIPAGVAVDRMRKRRVMVYCDLIQAAVVGSVPLASALGMLTLAQLFVVALAAGVPATFFHLANRSYLPFLVDRRQLTDANGKLTTTLSVGETGGPPLAGALAGLVGAAASVIVDSLSFLVSATTLVAIRARDQAAEPAAHAAAQSPDRGWGRGILAEAAAGFAFVRSDAILRRIVACTACVNLFRSVIIATQVIFLVRLLRLAPAAVGGVLALGTLGGVAGGLAAGWCARAFGSARIIWLSFLGLGWAGLIMPMARPGWGAVVFGGGFFALDAAASLYNVGQLTYRQASCPARLLGRVNAVVRWITWGVMPAGGLIGGALAGLVGVRGAVAAGVCGMWAASLWVFFSPLRQLRDIPQLTAGSS